MARCKRGASAECRHHRVRFYPCGGHFAALRCFTSGSHGADPRSTRFRRSSRGLVPKGLERIHDEFVHARVQGEHSYEKVNRRIDTYNVQFCAHLPHLSATNEAEWLAHLKEAEKEAYAVHQREIRKLRRNQIEKRITKLRELERSNPKRFYQKVLEALRPIPKNASPVKEKLPDGSVRFHRDAENAKRVTKQFWGDMAQSKTPPSPEANFSKFGSPRRPEQNQGAEELTASITAEELEESIRSLKNGKAMGTDEIQGELIKLYGPEQKKTLLFLFNFCVTHKWIPSTWKKGRIFLVHKGGAPCEPTNYRPISLLSIEYKMLTAIITRRTYKFVEENALLQDSQAGFRPGHSTHDHLRTLVNILEDSKHNKKELHLCYIDFRKAYDVTEHWAIERALQFHGFPSAYIELIHGLNQNLKSDVICDYGITDEFDVETGVRQGDGLSPLLFLLTLEPLLRALSSCENGYQLGTCKIGNLSFADDVTLVARNALGIQENWQKIQLYSELFGLKVNPSKCAYTYHYVNNTPNQLLAKTHTGELAPIPVIRPTEHYRYLGIQISLSLDWSKTIDEHAQGYRKVLSVLRQKNWLNQEQKIRIVNTVANAAVKYAAKIVPFPRSLLKTLDAEARNAVFRKANMNKNWCYMSKKDGGKGLEPLCDTAEELYASSIIYNGLKSKNSFARETTITRVRTKLQEGNIRMHEVHTKETDEPEQESNTIWDRRDSIERSLAILRESKFEIQERNAPNPLREKLLRQLNREKVAEKWSKLQKLVIASANRKISIKYGYIDQNVPLSFLLDGDKLDLAKIECLKEGPEQEREIFRTLLCTNQEGSLRPEFRTLLNVTDEYYDKNTLPRAPFRPGEFHQIDGKPAIATDGSYKDGRAGFGIYCGPASNWNFCGPVRNSQSNATGELTAIEVALTMLPFNSNGYVFLVDAESWMNNITRYPLMKHRERVRLRHGHRVSKICTLIREKHKNQISFKHVYSHVQKKLQDAVNKNNTKKTERIKKHMQALRHDADYAIEANEQADKLAEQGRESNVAPALITPTDQDPFFLTLDGKFFDEYLPLYMRDSRRRKHKEEFLTQPSGALFALEDGNIDRELSFNNKFDDLLNITGRNYVLAAARTDTLTLGHKYSKVISSNPNSWLRSDDRDTSGYCQFGCKDQEGKRIPERAKHFFNDCPRWDENKKQLFRDIKELIQWHERTALVDLLPCWFLRREARTSTNIPTQIKAIGQLNDFDPAAGILAFCPAGLQGALKEIGVKGGATRKVAGQIVARISNYVFVTYNTAYPQQAQNTPPSAPNANADSDN